MLKLIALVSAILIVSACGNTGSEHAGQELRQAPVLASAFGGQVSTLDVERELRNMTIEQRTRLLHSPDEFKKLVGVMLFQQKAEKIAEESGLIDEEYRYVLERDRQRSIARRLAGNMYEEADIGDLETAARDYYNNNPSLFLSEPRLEISHIQLNAPTKEDKERRRPLASELLAKIRNGADFGRLATDYSEDFGRYSAGDIGYIKQGDMVDEFWDAAKALDVGQISDVVETRVGLHIIKLTNRGPEGKTSYEDARESILQRIEEDFRKKAVEDWVLQVAPPSAVEIDDSALNEWWVQRYQKVAKATANDQ